MITAIMGFFFRFPYTCFKRACHEVRNPIYKPWDGRSFVKEIQNWRSSMIGHLDSGFLWKGSSQWTFRMGNPGLERVTNRIVGAGGHQIGGVNLVF